jgi:hypothetical protein
MNINLISGERLETWKYFLALQQKPTDIHFPLPEKQVKLNITPSVGTIQVCYVKTTTTLNDIT